MEKNSLLPYEYQIKSEDTYLFFTDNCIEYTVYFEKEIQAYFSSYQAGIAKRFFEFGFVPINIKLSEVNEYPYDERIIITVVKILKDYFDQNQNAIIYNCLAHDGRQGIRARYFDSIFQKVKQIEILKFDSVLGSEKEIQYFQFLAISTFLFLLLHLNCNCLLQIFY